MSNAYFKLQIPDNEPVNSYLPSTPIRASLKAELACQAQTQVEIPLIIGEKEIFTGKTSKSIIPYNHQHVLATFRMAGEKELKGAVEAFMQIKAEWEAMPREYRAATFLKAADLLAGSWRDRVNVATMLGQNKTAFQAEIDSACELADLLRFNVYFVQQIYTEQPNNTLGVWNRTGYRPLDGFAVATSPFSFTLIDGNLCTAPAIAGNTIMWKPVSTAVLSNYYFFKVPEEVGLPAGVINFAPCRGTDVSRYILTDPRLAGFHFTDSTKALRGVWPLAGEHINSYINYPRLVGGTGGKDFVFAHRFVQVTPLATALVWGAFEYQDQKCSAASCAFIPASLWPQAKKLMLDEISKIKVGDVQDFNNFMGAIIDANSFETIRGFIDIANQSQEAGVLCGGYDDLKGWFVYPTVTQVQKADYESMVKETSGPVLIVYVYPDEGFEKALKLCDMATPYALTGAIFVQDCQVVVEMERRPNNVADNFHISDRPTGAVTGQQPFGGARASGTNDKTGSILNMYRWIGPHILKGSLVSAGTVSYPFMDEV